MCITMFTKHANQNNNLFKSSPLPRKLLRGIVISTRVHLSYLDRTGGKGDKGELT